MQSVEQPAALLSNEPVRPRPAAHHFNPAVAVQPIATTSFFVGRCKMLMQGPAPVEDLAELVAEVGALRDALMDQLTGGKGVGVLGGGRVCASTRVARVCRCVCDCLWVSRWGRAVMIVLARAGLPLPDSAAVALAGALGLLVQYFISSTFCLATCGDTAAACLPLPRLMGSDHHRCWARSTSRNSPSTVTTGIVVSTDSTVPLAPPTTPKEARPQESTDCLERGGSLWPTHFPTQTQPPQSRGDTNAPALP